MLSHWKMEWKGITAAHVEVNRFVIYEGCNFKKHGLTIYAYQLLHDCPFPGKQILLSRLPLDLLTLFQSALDTSPITLNL